MCLVQIDAVARHFRFVIRFDNKQNDLYAARML